MRDSPEQWFNSLVRFHTKLFSSDKSKLPTVEDLANAIYRYKGMPLETLKHFGWPEVLLYDKNTYMAYYQQHIKDVKTYFKYRSNALLVLNVAESGSFKKLADFLNVHGVRETEPFPWLNKTGGI